MKWKAMFPAIGLMALSCVTFAADEHHGRGPHWGYEGEAGPDRWATLSPEYGACSGRNQSPINLTGMVKAELKPLRFAYNEDGYEVINNGHTIQVNFKAGSSISVDGTEFGLKQFHFHSPSEHRIDGRSYPLEAHLVHSDAEGNLAVISVVFVEGRANPVVGAAWERMPKAAGDRKPLSAKVAAAGLLPEKRDYYRYNGSLTTPPCTEGVRWLIMKEPMTVSKQQIEEFRGTLGFDNNRPLQPANARMILQ